jgi:hypothetical protein
MSIFDHPDRVASVMTWRCPHCGTLQPEASRCWACMRSPVSCGTCRHYRRSLVSHVGLCGLDRSRGPLSGDEVRACWEPAADAPSTGIFAASPGPSTTPTLDPPGRPVGEDPAAMTSRGHPGGPHAGLPAMRSPTADARHPSGPRDARATAASDTSTPAAGGLVEAPVVNPSRELVSEALRRARRGREAAGQ